MNLSDDPKGNLTIFPNDGESEGGVGNIIASIVMVLVNCIAVIANVSVLLVTLKTPVLRNTLTNFFVINLCIVDFLCSVLVMPVSITVFHFDRWPFGAVFCDINGFLNSLFAFASILSLSVISMERFYSIKMPMHHAAHMSLPKTIMTIAIIWLLSCVFGLLPILGWNSYVYRPNGVHCSFAWDLSIQHRLYIVITGIFCFFIPGCILCTMYCGVFHVAKKAATQTHPESTNITWTSFEPHGDSGSIASVRQSPQLNKPPENPPNPWPPKYSTRGHFKAIKTLLIILTTYIVLWGPFFALHIHGALNGYSAYSANVEIIVTWLGYSSYAINPFLYGWMNRSIRGELIKMCKCVGGCSCSTKTEPVPEEDRPRSNEDFFQFLERTSCAVPNMGGTCTS